MCGIAGLLLHGRAGSDDDDRRVVGFGNETPAFLMRAPPRLAPASDTED